MEWLLPCAKSSEAFGSCPVGFSNTKIGMTRNLIELGL